MVLELHMAVIHGFLNYLVLTSQVWSRREHLLAL